MKNGRREAPALHADTLRPIWTQVPRKLSHLTDTA
jgi:hypothetical protein